MVPNLDAMTEAELMDFWAKYARPTRADAKALVGDRPGYMNLASTLAAYAVAKTSAMGLRERGEIQRALVYESHCDLYYQDLPDDVRW